MMDLVEFAKVLGMTEEEFHTAVEEYHKTGVVKNRAVAIAVGLAYD